jgi:pyrroline-5-carboxylate reductase
VEDILDQRQIALSEFALEHGYDPTLNLTSWGNEVIEKGGTTEEGLRRALEGYRKAHKLVYPKQHE